MIRPHDLYFEALYQIQRSLECWTGLNLPWWIFESLIGPGILTLCAALCCIPICQGLMSRPKP